MPARPAGTTIQATAGLGAVGGGAAGADRAAGARAPAGGQRAGDARHQLCRRAGGARRRGLSLALPPAQRTVLDWIRLYGADRPARAHGQPADVTGFVYHDPRLQPGQFMVGRFTIACCVADAMALGMVVDWPESAELRCQ
jgi:uncharacterized repeat protein (TIGR03943 family)